METIILAAIKTGENQVSVNLNPNGRHCYIIHHLIRNGFDKPLVGEQGFLTSTGRFVDRVEAKKIAFNSGQIKETISNTLTSEDLW